MVKMVWKKLAGVVVLVLATSATAALAAPATPVEISERIKELGNDCALIGGGEFQYDDGFLVSAELNGDGNPDFVLNFNLAYCANAMSAFSGTTGASVEIWVSQADGSLKLSKSWIAPNVRVNTSFTPNALDLAAVNRAGDLETIVWMLKGDKWELVSVQPAAPGDWQ